MTSATDRTASANTRFADDLPMGDPADLARVRHGRIAGLDRLVVEHDVHHRPILDTAEWDFLDGDAPATVNPSLWRQARLNREHGLFELTPGLYQVRGYDISNLSLVEGESGWIVIDPLTSTETARAAMDLVREHLGDRPVTAVIYTHSHLDHFAGLAGVIDLDDLVARQVPIVAPEGFLREAVAENVIAGPAMLRRATYMYGALLPRGPLGQVDCGLGRSISAGSRVARRADARDHPHRRGAGARRGARGVPAHAGVGGAGGDDLPLPVAAGAVRGGELHERDAQPLHAARRAGARRARSGASTSTSRCASSATTPTSCSPATTGPASAPTTCATTCARSATRTATSTTRRCASPTTAS